MIGTAFNNFVILYSPYFMYINFNINILFQSSPLQKHPSKHSPDEVSDFLTYHLIFVVVDIMRTVQFNIACVVTI